LQFRKPCQGIFEAKELIMPQYELVAARCEDPADGRRDVTSFLVIDFLDRRGREQR
jgi:hypothetical protein